MASSSVLVDHSCPFNMTNRVSSLSFGKEGCHTFYSITNILFSLYFNLPTILNTFNNVFIQ